MCGIVGLLEPSQRARATVSAMLDQLVHRGPDDVGIWLDESGMTFGHRRLSVIDLSPAGHQPMISAESAIVITYNGEIYNHRALRVELERSGAAPLWRGRSDTEVLLACIEAWGVQSTLERCNGMFAMAIWDKHQQKLILARDRMGEKPLYFGWVAGRFAFTSELKAFSQIDGWSPRMHTGAIASFLGSGYVRGPQSAIDGVFRLPPGCSLSLSIEDLQRQLEWEQLAPRITKYWSLEKVAIAGLRHPADQDDEILEALETLLHDAVSLRMVADVPIGAFLSGGVDSSLVTAVMQAQSARSVCTFSIGFNENDFDEAPYARRVASHLGTEHTELYLSGNDARDLLPKLAAAYDEPFADSSQLPTLLVSQLARKKVTVALSGDGGDELFAGYSRYFEILEFLERQPQQSSNVDTLRLSFLLGSADLSHIQHAPVSRSLRHCSPPPFLKSPLRRLLYGDQTDYLPDDILHKVDRASMAYSLETRMPLLDHRLVELAWRLPDAMLSNVTRRKLLLRKMLNRYVPASLTDRPKQGFCSPMGAWLRGPLRDWADSLLSPASLRELPMINVKGVHELWAAHREHRTDASPALWNVLMLSEWRQRLGALCTNRHLSSEVTS